MIEKILQKFARKIKTVKGSGTIGNYFIIMGKSYIVSRADPNSNYLPFKSNNKLRVITNPLEKFLFLLSSFLFP